MELTTDVRLKGPIWAETLDKLDGRVFETYWDVYALSISIGMMYDGQIASEDMVPPDYEEKDRNIPRNVLGHAQNKALLEFMLQCALVTSKHLNLSEEDRLALAFDKDKELDFKPIPFLTRFANFGVTKIHEVISDTKDVETLEALMTFLNSTYESGVNIVDDLDDYIDDLDAFDFSDIEIE